MHAQPPPPQTAFPGPFYLLRFFCRTTRYNTLLTPYFYPIFVVFYKLKQHETADFKKLIFESISCVLQENTKLNQLS